MSVGSEAASWAIIESYTTEHTLVQAQIDSCNNFFEETIQSIVDNIPPVSLKDKNHKCLRIYKYGKCMVKPMRLPGFADYDNGVVVTPHMCRLRDLSYTCTLVIVVYPTLIHDNGTRESLKPEEVEIGDIPIMVKSNNCVLNGLERDALIELNECPYDQGGYFILNGKERAIVAQERLSYNQLFVFPEKNGLKAEIRSHCEDTDQQSTIHLKYATNRKQGPGVKLIIPHIHEPKGVLLFAVFMALGFCNKDEIIGMILYPDSHDMEMMEKIEGSVSESIDLTTREEAIAYLYQYIKPRITNAFPMPTGSEAKHNWLKKYLLLIIDKELFPHLHPCGPGEKKPTISMLSSDNDFHDYVTSSLYRKRCLEKVWYLAYATNRLFRVALSRDRPSDRDHMGHKRLNLAGPLLAQLFKKKFQSQHNSMVKLLTKHIQQNKDVTICGVMKQVDVTKGLAYSLKTGNWSGSKSNSASSTNNQGVSQVLNRMNFISPVSHLRRTSASDTNLSIVRQLHNTQYGICCLTKDTIITLFDGQTKTISDIVDNLDDVVVITVNPDTLDDEPSHIYNQFVKWSDTILHIYTADKKSIKCTPDHPFLVHDALSGCNHWVQAGALCINDSVVTVCNTSVSSVFSCDKMFSNITSISYLPGEFVYDFTTFSPNHSFIANGFVTHNCPSETPEGRSCGLVKNSALLCHITTGSKTHLVYEWINDNVDYINITDLHVNRNGNVFGWKIFINGKLLGVYPDGSHDNVSFDEQGFPKPFPEWVHLFREARSRGVKIDTQVSISTYSSDRKEIYIFTDEGRFSRPLLVVDRRTKQLRLTDDIVNKIIRYLDPSTPPGDGWSWHDLVEHRIVEYIDIAESEGPKIASSFSDVLDNHTLKNPYTHCEIHAGSILGVLASLISFPDHSQAPRNTYQSAMGKQAIGIPTLNFDKRYDTTNYVLYYPQTPIVRTKFHEILKTNKMPSGQTTIVAVIEYTGYNQEDSIILNQGWIDRGGGKCTLYKTYKAETKKHKILPNDKFEIPLRSETMGMKKGDYTKLGDDGIADIGNRCVKGDIIIGVTGPSPTFSSFSRTRSYNKANTQRVATNINPKLIKKDRSVSLRVDGIVDSVMLTENSDQTTMTKVRIRTIRTPKIGDKFASSVGQKGTVGLILRPQDMPYSERDGIVPDILMNPHAFPSRMTINQQIEMLFGKECALNMTHGDSTPFQSRPSGDENIVDVISKQLLLHGYDPKGEEVMIDGVTGRKLKAKIFVGPAYYQRLKHMVDDKKHSRSKGPHNQLTRQPVEGRMRDGGLRVGEMEKDTLVAHGASYNLLSLMMKKSDQFTVPYCGNPGCGLIAEAKPDKNIYYCRACDDMDHVYLINCPYAQKLLFQELMGMLIVPRVDLESPYLDN